MQKILMQKNDVVKINLQKFLKFIFATTVFMSKIFAQKIFV